MNDKRIDLMRNAPINKAVNALSAPAIIGMLVMAIYNIVDSIFVSWISDTGYEMAATQVVLPVMLIASSIGLALGMGGASYISRLLGKNNKDEANKVATVTFFTGIVLGIIVTTINLVLLEPILNLFGADVNTLELAKDYGQFIVIGYAIIILNMMLNNMLRGEGSAKLSMIAMVSGSVLNIILDPIFIFGFNWGISGAAIATTLSQIVSFTILISVYLNNKTLVKISPKYFKPSKSIYQEVLKIGVPTFARQMLVSISIGIINNAASDISTDLLTALGIVIRVTMLPMYIVFGFGQGFQPVAGYNLGAGDKQRVVDSFKYTMKVSAIIMAISAVLFIVSNDLVFIIYNSNASVTSYGIIGIRYYFVGLFFMGLSNTITVLYQALGKGMEALILSVSRQGVFFIPLALILPNLLGYHGVLMTQAVADLLTVILSTAFVIPFLKSDKIDNLINLHKIQ